MTTHDPTSAPTDDGGQAPQGTRDGTGRRKRSRLFRSRGDTPRRRTGVVAGILTAVVVLVAGGAFVLTRSPSWSASTQLLVGPGPQVPEAEVSGYYETLSRGQVVATAAELVGERRFEVAAARDASVDPALVGSRVAVQPGTALVDIDVTAPNGSQASQVADGIARRSLPDVDRLLSPYRAYLVDPGRTASRRSGASDGQLVALVVLAAVVAGVGVWQLVRPRAPGVGGVPSQERRTARGTEARADRTG